MAPSCVPASPFESPRRPLAPGDLEALMRRRRVLGLAEMMNFPGVVAGDAGGAREARARGRAARRRSRARRPRQRAAGVRRCRHPLGPRGAHRRGGPGAAAGRDVAPDPRGVDGAQPPGPAAAGRRVRARPDRVLHGRPRSGGHRRQRPRQRHGARRGRGRDRSGGRAPDGEPPSGPVARARAATARSRPATTPTCSCCPISSGSSRTSSSSAGRPIAEIARAEVPEWVRQTVRIEPVGARGSRDPGRRVARCGRSASSTDQVVTRVARAGAARRRRASAVADPGRDLAKIAVVERHLGTGRIGLGLALGLGAACAARSPRPSRTTRTTSSSSARTTRTWSSRSVGWRRSAAGSSPSRTDRSSPSARSRSPVCSRIARSTSSIEQSRTTNEAAHGLGWRGATPFLTLAFLALSVIPSLKLTDKGLVDVDRFELVPLAAGEPTGLPRSQ